MSRILFWLFVFFAFCPITSAREQNKETSTIFIVGAGKASRSFANDLAQDQMMINKKKAEIKAIEKKVDAGEYDTAIKDLLARLDVKGWKFFDHEILKDLVRANAGAGKWDEAIKYQREIITRSVRGNWVMEDIADYWKLLEDYRRSVSGAVIGEQIPMVAQELIAYQERLQKFYVKKTEGNKAYLLDLANFYMVRLRLDKAEDYVTQAVSIPAKKDYQKREDGDAYAMLRNTHMLQGRYQKAFNDNEWLIKNIPYGYEKELAVFLQEAIASNPDPKKIEYEFTRRNFKAVIRK